MAQRLIVAITKLNPRSRGLRTNDSATKARSFVSNLFNHAETNFDERR
jgi:hypothetical protein